MILVTGATGMFGSRIVAELASQGLTVGAMGRSAKRLSSVVAPGVRAVVADMDDPPSLGPALAGVDVAFLVTPMDQRIAVRERAFIDAAKEAGIPRVVKLYGAVRHRGDALDALHLEALAHLRACGLRWSVVSPQSVMETNLYPQAQAIKETGALWGSAGQGKVGLVAADDCARAAAAVLTTEGHDGENYEITGPEALTFSQVAEKVGRAIGKQVVYNDLPEDQFAQLLVETAGMTEEQVELGVLVHFRAFRRGDADLVTDTYQRLTGEPPTSLDAWLAQHAGVFSSSISP